MRHYEDHRGDLSTAACCVDSARPHEHRHHTHTTWESEITCPRCASQGYHHSTGLFLQFCALATKQRDSLRSGNSFFLVSPYRSLATTGEPRRTRSAHGSCCRKQLPENNCVPQRNRKSWHFTGTDKGLKARWLCLLLPPSAQLPAHKVAGRQHCRDERWVHISFYRDTV